MPKDVTKPPNGIAEGLAEHFLMSKQRPLDIIHEAQCRAVAIHSNAPRFALGDVLSIEGYRAKIDAARDAVFRYMALQSQLNAQRGVMLAAGRELAEWSNRMLCGVQSAIGKDSQQSQAVAAATPSAPRRTPRKRCGTAGRRAAGSMPGRSTARGSGEVAAPVAHEGPVGKALVAAVGQWDEGTEPQGNPGDTTEAVPRNEAHAPLERQAREAGPADAVERRREIDGAETVAGEDVEAPKPKALVIDAPEAGCAFADALAMPGAIHEDTPQDGNDPGADGNPGDPQVVEGAEDPGGRDGEGEVRPPGLRMRRGVMDGAARRGGDADGKVCDGLRREGGQARRCLGRCRRRS